MQYLLSSEDIAGFVISEYSSRVLVFVIAVQGNTTATK